MDPRIKTSATDLRKQFEMESASVEGMNRSFDALAQVRSVRAQLKERAARAKGAVADAIAALDKQAGELEGAARSNFFGLPPGAKQPENFSSLNQHFSGILSVADSGRCGSHDPSNHSYKNWRRPRETRRSLTKIRQQDISALNAKLKKARLAPIDPGKSAETPAADADGDDVP